MSDDLPEVFRFRSNVVHRFVNESEEDVAYRRGHGHGYNAATKDHAPLYVEMRDRVRWLEGEHERLMRQRDAYIEANASAVDKVMQLDGELTESKRQCADLLAALRRAEEALRDNRLFGAASKCHKAIADAEAAG